MKPTIAFTFTLASLLYAQTDTATGQCNMHIDTIKNDTSQFTLIIRHNPKCEVLIDHHQRKIILISKKHTALLPDTKIDTVDTKTEKILALAKSKLGNSYEPAKTGPDHFDCSGFVYYVFRHNGIKIPRTSLTQSQSGKKIKREALKRGDMVFFDTHKRKHVNHSGIYLGKGKFIHSSSGKAYGVTISNIDKGFYKDKFRWGVRKLEE